MHDVPWGYLIGVLVVLAAVAAALRPPPTLVVHGALDPMVSAPDARAFAERLHAISGPPVAYAEVPGMLHVFDRFDAVRHGGVTVGALHFLDRLGLSPGREAE